MLTEQNIDRLIIGAARILHAVADYWEARIKLLEEPKNAEVWKHGEPRPQAETKEEYRELPGTGPGRFTDFVTKARPK